MRPSTFLSDAFGWFRAPVPAPALPEPESPLRRFTIRAIAVTALVASAIYLTWRATQTVDLAVWWVSVPLLVLEIHAALGLALFTFSLWDVDAAPPGHPAARSKRKVAVLIPTYDEGIEILIPTIAAAKTMRGRHQTWVLDDGNRPEVKRLARELGVKYLTRAEHEHAKAGNLNNALSVVKADLVAVLYADHVADPAFLERTLGYFDDPAVAVVQTPQEFYNHDSFEHEAVAGDGERFHEQSLYYRMLQPGKNRWDGAFWCGTGAVLRVVALGEIGGVATDTITEDIHTTIRLHRRGWKTVYHNEVLARGLAAADADTYQLQRLRWGTGAMQVLRVENPLVVPGLTLPQRLSYASTLLGGFDAWRTLGLIVLPIVVVATGALPIRADFRTFAVAFGVTFILQQVALKALSRGAHRVILSAVFEVVRMTANLRATLSLVTRRSPTFTVTPKGRLSDGRTRVRAPLPLQLTLAASVVAGAWFALTLLGRTPVTYEVPGAVVVAFGWMLFNLGLVGLAIARMRSLRYAPERRASVRFVTDLPAWLDELPAETMDVSTTGARVVAHRSVPIGRDVRLTFDVDDEVVTLVGAVRSTRPDVAGLTVHGVEFAPGQHAAQARLALALFQTQATPRVERFTEPAGTRVARPVAAPA